jgi:hypothetical protein
LQQLAVSTAMEVAALSVVAPAGFFIFNFILKKEINSHVPLICHHQPGAVIPNGCSGGA